MNSRKISLRKTLHTHEQNTSYFLEAERFTQATAWRLAKTNFLPKSYSFDLTYISTYALLLQACRTQPRQKQFHSPSKARSSFPGGSAGNLKSKTARRRSYRRRRRESCSSRSLV